MFAKDMEAPLCSLDMENYCKNALILRYVSAEQDYTTSLLEPAAVEQPYASSSLYEGPQQYESTWTTR